MSKPAKTKDELYLMKIYHEAQTAGDLAMPFNRYEIGEKVGMQKTAIDTVCKSLLRTNFLRRHNEDEVYLTHIGIRLVEELLENESDK